MSLIEHFILFVISLLANTFSALSGGGAGLIQFPVLIFLGLSFSVALATHKVASVALGLGAALRYINSSRLERQFVILLLMAGLPGGSDWWQFDFVGSRQNRRDCTGNTHRYIRTLFIV